MTLCPKCGKDEWWLVSEWNNISRYQCKSCGHVAEFVGGKLLKAEDEPGADSLVIQLPVSDSAAVKYQESDATLLRRTALNAIDDLVAYYETKQPENVNNARKAWRLVYENY